MEDRCSRVKSPFGLACWSVTTTWGWEPPHCRYETCRPLGLAAGATARGLLVVPERRAVGQGSHRPGRAERQHRVRCCQDRRRCGERGAGPARGTTAGAVQEVHPGARCKDRGRRHGCSHHFGGDRLLQVIAAAGGSDSPVHDVFVRLSRNGVTASVPMATLVADPEQNIFAEPGDVVTLMRQPKTFSAFGAAGKKCL